jgi:hypothetical protein
MTDATHLSSASTPGALQGLANAFLTSPNLVDTASGTARLQTVQGNGDVPQAEINSLANMLVTCVNSDGNSGCTPLFSNALDASGTAPTDTIAAAPNIPHKHAPNITPLHRQPITRASSPPRCST